MRVITAGLFIFMVVVGVAVVVVGGFVGGSRFMSFALLRLLLRRFYNFALLSSSSLSAVPHAVGVAARAAPSVTLFPAIARSQTGPRVITSPSSSLTA